MIEREVVLNIARLARLELAAEEIEPLAAELTEILHHCDQLSSMDLADVPPMTHVEKVSNVLRSDEERPSLDREVALGQAPDHDDGMFRVPSPQT